jgi:hypothetical protein
LESNPRDLDTLSDWPAIRNYGRSLWGQSTFDAKPLELILDWLVAEHGKGIDHPAEFTPRHEVVALLRAASQKTRWERLKKWAQNNRVVVVVFAIVAVVTACATLVSGLRILKHIDLAQRFIKWLWP